MTATLKRETVEKPFRHVGNRHRETVRNRPETAKKLSETAYNRYQGNHGNHLFIEMVSGFPTHTPESIEEKHWIYWAGKPSSSADLAAIALLIAADPELAERAAIREIDGGMSREDAERAALQDLLDEVAQMVEMNAMANRRNQQ
jgi:hypothetical protein